MTLDAIITLSVIFLIIAGGLTLTMTRVIDALFEKAIEELSEEKESK